MNQTIQKQIINEIQNFDTIIIHRHANPDPDALGSQGGLQHLLKTSFPEKKIYVVGEEVEGLTFLNRMDKISDKVYHNALVIVCDTANTKRISDSRYQNGKKLIKIDHHPNREPYGDLIWVDTEFSSASEMIAELALHNQDVFNISKDAARLLFAGIIGDTGRFLYNNTTQQTMKYTGELLAYDFSPQDIYNELYKASRQVARLQGSVLLNHEVTNQGVAYFKVTDEVMKEFDVNQVEAANLVSTLSNIEGNKVWVFFIQYPEEIRVRIRSKQIVINEVAYQFNGGGHPLASGATVQNWEEASKLIEALNKLIEENESK